MDGLILDQTARATGKFTTLELPVRKSTPVAMPEAVPESTQLFSASYWAVAWFAAVTMALVFALSFASPCTGSDLNAGCVPVALAP